LDQSEDHLIFAFVDDEEHSLDEECARRLFTLPGRVTGAVSGDAPAFLQGATQKRQDEIRRGISERNARFFEMEAEKLDGWAEDLKLALEREIKELDRQIKETRRAATTALTLEEKLAGQKQIRSLEAQRNEKRRSLFEAQDDVDRRRGELILQIEGKLTQSSNTGLLFAIKWALS
jgi:adenine-specific DNA-methyltransferase